MTDDILELLTTEGDHAETHDLPDDAGTDLRSIVRQVVSADWQVPPAG